MWSSIFLTLLVAGLCVAGGHPADMDDEYLSSLDNHASGLAGKLRDVLHTNKDKLVFNVNEAVDALMAILERFHAKLGLLTISDVKQFTRAVDQIVSMQHRHHQRVLSEFWRDCRKLVTSSAGTEYFKKLIANATENLDRNHFRKNRLILAGNKVISLRLQTINSSISNVVSPFKHVVSRLGDTLKEYFSNLVDAVKGHNSNLNDKLSRQVEELKTRLERSQSPWKGHL